MTECVHSGLWKLERFYVDVLHRNIVPIRFEMAFDVPVRN
jgi:hypothetical protein